MAEKATPETFSRARAFMDESFSLSNDLLGGVFEMRAAGTRRLPRHGEELNETYRQRLDRAVLFNYYRQAALQLGGRPFREPVVVHNELPPPLEGFKDNVDQRGSSLTTFGARLFLDGLTKGLAYCLVEHPRTPDDVKTLEDQRKLNLRPYFVRIPPENLISARVEISPNGRETFTQVRILEVTMEPDPTDPWAEVEFRRVRVYEPDSWSLWEEQSSGKKKEWVEVDFGANTLGRVPLVVFYADRTDVLTSRPPLEDLAHANVAHWQSGSEQQHVLTVTRFPILAASGVDEQEDTLVVGPDLWLKMTNPEAKAYYVEHTGQAIEAGRRDMKDWEERMAVLSVDLLIRRAQDRASATGRSLDDTKTGSFLFSMALDFSEFLEQCLNLAAAWVDDEEFVASVRVAADFDLGANDAAGLQTLLQARAVGDLSRETFLNELKRRSVLPDVFKVEEEEGRLAAEGPPLGAEADPDLDPEPKGK